MTVSTEPLTTGERVCVHGKGFGEIVEIVERERFSGGSYAVVAIPRRERHKPSGQTISWTERVNVSLDVYPPHLSRSAA